MTNVLDLPAILKQAEAAGEKWSLGAVDDEEGNYILLVVDGNGYARITPHAPKPFLEFIIACRTNVPMLVTALQEAQEEARKLRHWARDGKRVWAHIVIESCNAILGEGK